MSLHLQILFGSFLMLCFTISAVAQEPTLNPSRVAQVAIKTKDLARATAFYRDTIGLKVLAVPRSVFNMIGHCAAPSLPDVLFRHRAARRVQISLRIGSDSVRSPGRKRSEDLQVASPQDMHLATAEHVEKLLLRVG